MTYFVTSKQTTGQKYHLTWCIHFKKYFLYQESEKSTSFLLLIINRTKTPHINLVLCVISFTKIDKISRRTWTRFYVARSGLSGVAHTDASSMFRGWVGTDSFSSFLSTTTCHGTFAPGSPLCPVSINCENQKHTII